MYVDIYVFIELRVVQDPIHANLYSDHCAFCVLWQKLKSQMFWRKYYLMYMYFSEVFTVWFLWMVFSSSRILWGTGLTHLRLWQVRKETKQLTARQAESCPAQCALFFFPFFFAVTRYSFSHLASPYLWLPMRTFFIYADFFHKLDSGFFFFLLHVCQDNLRFIIYVIYDRYKLSKSVKRKVFFLSTKWNQMFRWFIIHNLTS